MLLDEGQALPRRPRRVLVAGTSGAGKTRLAVALGQLLDVPRVEIDGLFHGPGWTPRETFVADVEAFSAGPEWVTEWQYAAVRPLLAARADLLVWLDLRRSTVLRQVVLRTVRRRLRREVLWHGNVEPPLRTLLTDREHVVRWAWTTHPTTGPRVTALLEQHPELVVVRLPDHHAVRRWLAGPLRASLDLPA